MSSSINVNMTFTIVVPFSDNIKIYFSYLDNSFLPHITTSLTYIFGEFGWFQLIVWCLSTMVSKPSVHDRVWPPFYYSNVRWSFLSFAYKNIKSLKCRWRLWISFQTDIYEKLPGKASEFKRKIVDREAADASQLHIKEIASG